MKPPCERCPKFLLYPEGPKAHALTGLLPENYDVVGYFQRASQQICSFGGTLGLMTADAAQSVLNEYDNHFEFVETRNEAFDFMWLINRVATETIQKREEADRQAAENKGKADGQRSRSIGRGRQ